MQAVQIRNGFFLVFNRGDNLMPALIAFCEQNDVHWGQFTAIGALEDVEIGYYDLQTREYFFKFEQGPFEVASMNGNISEMAGEKPVVHAHTVLSRPDQTLECIGGHLRSARVAFTLEMCLWHVSQPLIRQRDEETGLNLIHIEV
ncbi:hypothetical protein COU18_02360 [Candidatus Kaiserbacteria bacterium CG10_big_fil_rev_8_21_14_0_10_51_14]|uniref:PPC domain-containing protein n=1 Tax=Candidatus Kaiserbacteria bacterium CG10_big_fil_rev_8_21_14_0_10_51_14 TaxID=1974610 RepID=A0A2H0UDE7_9BACT|nr:MAG: hypothetical protein COU18_02360 [Candidatus Kaiserbacteria bacterium CG10_big_fil_rev_8_21_14_0_10_51_14]